MRNQAVCFATGADRGIEALFTQGEMRPNVKQFVRLLSEAMEFPSPVLDAGSMHTEGQEHDADLRPLIGAARYLGVDMRPGPGVDVIGSVHHLPVPASGAGTVLVLDTLEHVLDPIAAMREVCGAVAPGGVVIVSSHMNFPMHAHPSDYWRFTPMIFDHLLAPLATRFVFIQGDAENPHNVMGVAMKATTDGAAEVTFRGAVRQVQARWAEDSYGGPLVLHERLTIDVSQRDSGIDLPELVAGRVIQQEFTCGADGLSRIDVKMSNRAGETLRHVLFRLSEAAQPQHTITAHRLLAWHVVDDAWVAVPVPAQARSGGRRYILSVESPDGVAGNTVSVKGTAQEVSGLDLRVDDKATAGALAFQAYCQRPHIAAEDIQTGELIAHDRTSAQPAVPGGADRTLAMLNEEHWAQVRYLAAELTAELDAIREQLRREHAEQLDVQRRTLDASTEKLLARTVRDNPVARVLRRGKPGGRT